ncbi:MAG TPA: hypothetical protein VHC22_02060 [Pirellulales bacterium]|nr:hypothetical protein [Pirellulales bacterium]
MRVKQKDSAGRGVATLGELTITTKDTQFSYKLAALGTVGTTAGMIAILSTVASQTAIKALHACLSKAAKTTFSAKCEGFDPDWELMAASGGYRFQAVKLGYSTWHSLALARTPGLISKLNDTSLWTELQRESITTPLLPSWLPWLRKELEREGHLTALHSFQCGGAVLDLNTESLDELVSRGLRRRRFTI